MVRVLIKAQFQRIQSLLEDIFEESDSFPAELSTEDLQSSKFFTNMSRNESHPLLSSRAVGKLIEYMSRLKGKRRADSPEWDLDAFTRILRLLERSMREIDEITVFDEPKNVEVKKTVKVGKGKKNSKSPELPSDETPVKAEVELSEDQVHGLEGDLQKIASAGIAAACVLTLLDLDGLPKQVCRRCYWKNKLTGQMYSEDLLSLAVSLTKDQLSGVIFPVVSCLGGDSECDTQIWTVLICRIVVGLSQSRCRWRNDVFQSGQSFFHIRTPRPLSDSSLDSDRPTSNHLPRQPSRHVILGLACHSGRLPLNQSALPSRVWRCTEEER